MMRPHCDRCDKLCDECPSWVEDNITTPNGVTDPIWHIEINVGSLVRDQMFCRACRIAILEAHVAALKLMPGHGGHLADCKWDASMKRYDCADGCEIKKLNDEYTLRTDVVL